jgi:hypothetical protein
MANSPPNVWQSLKNPESSRTGKIGSLQLRGGSQHLPRMGSHPTSHQPPSRQATGGWAVREHEGQRGITSTMDLVKPTLEQVRRILRPPQQVRPVLTAECGRSCSRPPVISTYPPRDARARRVGNSSSLLNRRSEAVAQGQSPAGLVRPLSRGARVHSLNARAHITPIHPKSPCPRTRAPALHPVYFQRIARLAAPLLLVASCRPHPRFQHGKLGWRCRSTGHRHVLLARRPGSRGQGSSQRRLAAVGCASASNFGPVHPGGYLE